MVSHMTDRATRKQIQYLGCVPSFVPGLHITEKSVIVRGLKRAHTHSGDQ